MRKLAQRQSVSKRYLDNIFATLRVARIVKAVRGAAGGYLLARPASSISVLEIVELLDGPLTLVDCVAENHFCALKGSCCTHGLWGGASKLLRGYLADISIADLAVDDCPGND
mgnify:CR=1 FL=1